QLHQSLRRRSRCWPRSNSGEALISDSLKKSAAAVSSLLLSFSLLIPNIAEAQNAKPQNAQPSTTSSGPQAGVQFVDVTAKSGIRFTHNNGAFGKKFLPETI